MPIYEEQQDPFAGPLKIRWIVIEGIEEPLEGLGKRKIDAGNRPAEQQDESPQSGRAV